MKPRMATGYRQMIPSLTGRKPTSIWLAKANYRGWRIRRKIIWTNVFRNPGYTL